MDALEKTKMHESKWIPVENIVKNEQNPNKMSPREFDLLVDNISRKGATEPIEVRELADGKFRIIGGHHRFDAILYLGWDEAPCIVNNDPDMTDDEEKFQLVRMNMIHGKLDPEKFLALYKQMSPKYEEVVLQEMFGFADEKEFKKMISEAGKSLPPELQAAFKEAAKEIKTIEDLANVLNQLLTDYGDTLEYGYMIFDFNGKSSVWLRMKAQDMEVFLAVSERCRKEKRAMDDIFMEMLNQVAGNETQLASIIANTPVVNKTTPNHVPMTRDNLDNVGVQL